jgi:hypothetical protein
MSLPSGAVTCSMSGSRIDGVDFGAARMATV